ncbi:hypothetical protein [Vulgatibacter sp.]|uniref:hypothetical protein n=1 Tax=Vulgatibacter sp. TaxID=1971226 RepID=UPI003561E28E
MKRHLWGAAVAALLIGAVACGEDEDERAGDTAGCTIDNCRAMTTSCGAILPGEPAGYCYGTPGMPEEYDPTWCVESCNKLGRGESVACFAAQAARCDELRGESAPAPDDLAEIISACAEPLPSPDATCSQRCTDERQACLETCSRSSWEACTPCAHECFLAEHLCRERCE